MKAENIQLQEKNAQLEEEMSREKERNFQHEERVRCMELNMKGKENN